MYKIAEYPGYPLGAIQTPHSVRIDDGKTYVMIRDRSGTHIYETAGRINGNYPIRRELVPDNRDNAIEHGHVTKLFAMKYEEYLSFHGFHPDKVATVEEKVAA